MFCVNIYFIVFLFNIRQNKCARMSHVDIGNMVTDGSRVRNENIKLAQVGLLV